MTQLNEMRFRHITETPEEYLNRMRQLYAVEPNDINYPFFKILEDGKLACIVRLATTWGLCLGGDDFCSYRFRFCFPNLIDAIEAYNNTKTIYDIPVEGWCAARPENRMLLTRDLIEHTDNRKDDEFCKKLVSNVFLLIEDAISAHAYNKKAFINWLGKCKIESDSSQKLLVNYIGQFKKGRKIVFRMFAGNVFQPKQAEEYAKENNLKLDYVFISNQEYKLNLDEGLVEFFNNLPDKFVSN